VTRNPLFVNAIYYQSKHVKSSSKHSKIKYGGNCGGFSKGRKDMGFHGLVDHVRYYFISKYYLFGNINLTHCQRPAS